MVTYKIQTFMNIWDMAKVSNIKFNFQQPMKKQFITIPHNYFILFDFQFMKLYNYDSSIINYVNFVT